MGIPTLIKTLTADDDASLSFVDGASSVVLDGTYDEYMFVATDINAATDSVQFYCEGSTDTGSSYGVTKTMTWFNAYHDPDDDAAALGYSTTWDRTGSGTDAIVLMNGVDNAAPKSAVSILHVFSPASTTFVKHFYSHGHGYHSPANSANNVHLEGYFNTTSAVDAFKFTMSSGNFDGVIQLYGIS